VRVTRQVFERLVDLALREVPPQFDEYLANVVIDVEDLPDAATCRQLGLADARTLFGQYHGVPLTGRHVEEAARLPDRIVIYQANIERACRSRDDLIAQIRTTVLHEIGHHFGLDEDDLDEVGYG
jgi:predicted Zn-dependent protease with MMP-like domain